MAQRTRKRILGISTALVLVGLLIWSLLPRPHQVATAPVSQGDFEVYIAEEGITELREPYRVSAPIQGYLQRVSPEPGDQVAAGDPLFTLEPLPAPALDPRARHQAREALASAQARHQAMVALLENQRSEREFAVNELRRIRDLHQQDSASETELDRARTTARRAETAEEAAVAAVEAAQYEVANARTVLSVAAGERSSDTDPLTIRAPIAGVVLEQFRCCEGVVMPGTDILKIGDLSELEVRVDVLSADAVQLRPGMSVEMTQWGGEHTLTGEVRRVKPAGYTRLSALGIEEQRVPVSVTITSPLTDWEHLGAGYRVEARIIHAQPEAALHVPVSAVFREQDQHQVFVVENGRARLRAVTTGARSGLQQEITAGLEPAQQVIIHPAAALQDGSRVRPEP